MTVYKGPNFNETGIIDIKTHIKKEQSTIRTQIMYHPEPSKKAIATGEAIRYLRTNSREETFNHVTKKLKKKTY